MRTYRHLLACLACVPVLSACESAASPAPLPGTDAGATACTDSSQCDDGLYCNGIERCVRASTGASCVAGTPPCPAASCLEEEDRCGCEIPDADGDGFDAEACGGADCDDQNRMRYPGAAEICDAADLDEDCDPETFGFRDQDGDDHADDACCNIDGSELRCGQDCNDTARGIHPDTIEQCNLRDDDCDARVDEDAQVMLYRDQDGDRFGEPSSPMLGCADLPPPGYSAQGGDCDDDDDSIHPGAPERCVDMVDDDCDGMANEDCVCAPEGSTRPCSRLGVCAAGVETCQGRTWSECSINPRPYELCNGEDDDCNGMIDDGQRGPCWPDVDRDGFAAMDATSSDECLVGFQCPFGFTATAPTGTSFDCADNDPLAAPTRFETCNSRDDDCDGRSDEGVSVQCYLDADNDTFAPGNASATDRCPDAARTDVGLCPIGWTDRPPSMPTQTDCDDSLSLRRPSAREDCSDRLDNDCNGVVDDGDTVTCYSDPDGDGYAAAGAMAEQVCGLCPGRTTSRAPLTGASIDCRPDDLASYPGATELCETSGPQIDQDCDGQTNDTVQIACYRDMDADGYAPTGASVMMLCPQQGGLCPFGFTSRPPSAADFDCQDNNPTIHSRVVEQCDPLGTDTNCNPADEGLIDCYVDADDDGYATYQSPVAARQCRSLATDRDNSTHRGCSFSYTGRPPATRESADCDDSAASFAVAIYCHTDEDRDGYPAGTAADQPRWVCPGGPGYGGCPSGLTTRAQGSGVTDCCDSDRNASPGQTFFWDRARMTCGGYDYDCDGTETREFSRQLSPGTCNGVISESMCTSRSDMFRDAVLDPIVPTCGSNVLLASGCFGAVISGTTVNCMAVPFRVDRQSCR